MKRVVIVRHAKAEQSGYDHDIERNLTERGEEDADLVSREAAKRKIFPDIMISSPAKRTTKTAEIFASNLNYPKKSIRFDKKLFSGRTADSFLEMLKDIEDEFNTVFIFGHNPTVSYYMIYLLDDFTYDVPTCSTVAIDFNITSWQYLKPGSGKLALRIIPDFLKD